MTRTAAAIAATLLAACSLAAATGGARANPAITVGGVSTRGAALNNVYRAQQRNSAALNRVQNNINASRRARYRAQ